MHTSTRFRHIYTHVPGFYVNVKTADGSVSTFSNFFCGYKFAEANDANLKLLVTCTRTPVATLAYRIEEDRAIVSISVCHPNDTFCKRTGRLVAEGRLLAKGLEPYVCNVKTFSTVPLYALLDRLVISVHKDYLPTLVTQLSNFFEGN